MDHVTLYRTGADDRHLDHEVVVRTGPETRQHRHLRTRLDLEHARRVGVADHVVHGGILRRHRGERPARATKALHQVEGAADCGEHAETENVHLEQSERVEIILVPLDDRAVGHRGVLDRHQFLEQIPRDDEATHVLREVP